MTFKVGDRVRVVRNVNNLWPEFNGVTGVITANYGHTSYYDVKPDKKVYKEDRGDYSFNSDWILEPEDNSAELICEDWS